MKIDRHLLKLSLKYHIGLQTCVCGKLQPTDAGRRSRFSEMYDAKLLAASENFARSNSYHIPTISFSNFPAVCPSRYNF